KEEETKIIKKFEIIQKEFKQEDQKRVELEGLEKSQSEKNTHLRDIESRITIKQQELKKTLNQEVPLEEQELKTLWESHKELKQECEKKQKELESLIKTQEHLELELQSVNNRIADNKNSQESSKDLIEKRKKSIIKDLPELKSLDYSEWKSSILSKIEISNNLFEKLKVERDNIRIKETELTSLETKIKFIVESMDKTKTKLEKAIKKCEKFDPNWETTLKELSKINFVSLLEKQEEMISKLNEEMNSLITQKGILENNLNERDNEIKELESLKKGAKCPHCKQIITDEHKSKIIEEIKNQVIGIQNEMTKNVSQIEVKGKQFKENKTKKNEIEKDLKVFEQLKPLAENVNTLKEQIENDNEEKINSEKELKSIIIDKPSQQYDTEISIENEKKTISLNVLKSIDEIDDAQRSLNGLITKINELMQKSERINKEFKPDILKMAKEERDQIVSRFQDEIKIIPALSNIIERVNEKNAIFVEIKKINSVLDEKKKSFDKKKYDNLIQEKDQISRKIGEVKKEIETLSNEIIPTIESRISEMKNKLEELDEKETEQLREKKREVLIKMIRDFCREITPVLRQQKTTQISAKATEIFLDLIGNLGEFDGISITDNYDLYVTRYGMDEDITILSGGEQVISCLAIRLAIAEVLANQGLILLDEPTSHLDEGHVKDLVEVFELYSPARQIITVTHDDEFEKIADSLIQVYKKNRISQIL
ncbi:MAG TPA: hypothetical protein VMV49_15210, partial [Candidatus Deferrimicrobium sp.]|nr:hypothetical protein [Candidatus Deferrimicrobium sp.]